MQIDGETDLAAKTDLAVGEAYRQKAYLSQSLHGTQGDSHLWMTGSQPNVWGYSRRRTGVRQCDSAAQLASRSCWMRWCDRPRSSAASRRLSPASVSVRTACAVRCWAFTPARSAASCERVSALENCEPGRRVTVVIPTYNRQERLRKTIEAVFASTVSDEVKQAVGRAESRQQALALLFMSAEFQRR